MEGVVKVYSFSNPNTIHPIKSKEMESEQTSGCDCFGAAQKELVK
jgi:hypothetical protein